LSGAKSGIALSNGNADPGFADAQPGLQGLQRPSGGDSIVSVNPIEKCFNIRPGSRKVSRGRVRSRPAFACSNPGRNRMSNLAIYEMLAQAFAGEGVDTPFSLLGDGNMH
jgi:hypothetical protein